jgi:hypothetical protein
LLPKTSLDGARITIRRFRLGQAQEMARVLQLHGGAPRGHLAVLAQNGWQPKGLQVRQFSRPKWYRIATGQTWSNRNPGWPDLPAAMRFLSFRMTNASLDRFELIG